MCVRWYVNVLSKSFVVDRDFVLIKVAFTNSVPALKHVHIIVCLEPPARVHMFKFAEYSMYATYNCM